MIIQASTSSHGMLTLDLVAEEDGFFPDYDGDSWENSLHGGGSALGPRGVGVRQRADTDVSKLWVTSKEPMVKTGSLPRGSERSWGKQSHLEASKVHKTQQVQIRKLSDACRTFTIASCFANFIGVCLCSMSQIRYFCFGVEPPGCHC